jgi:hypothetical protein
VGRRWPIWEKLVKHEIILTVAWLVLALPLRSQAPKATLVAGTDQTCPAQLPDGSNYEIHFRTLKARWKDRDVFVLVNAYYKPGSGEFLYYSTIISKEGYLRDFKEVWARARTCKPIEGHTVLLEDREWADFWASSRLDVYHSALQFVTIGEAWQYVSTHFEECQSGSTKCWEEIPVYKQLPEMFFRPESLRWDARPYFYNSLVSAKKAEFTWEVVIKGADEPNRALVILDQNFKLVKITRFAAPN